MGKEAARRAPKIIHGDTVTGFAFVAHLGSKRYLTVVARASVTAQSGALVVDRRPDASFIADDLAPYLPQTDVLVLDRRGVPGTDAARSVDVRIATWPTRERPDSEVLFSKIAPAAGFHAMRSADTRIYLEEARARSVAYLPDTVAWSSFHRAPPDQRAPHLTGNEIVTVDTGATRDVYPLPHLVVEARLAHDAGAPMEIALTLDTVEVFTASRALALCFRNHVEIPDDDAAYRVFLRMRTAHATPPWPRDVAGPSSVPPRFMSTMVMDPPATVSDASTEPPPTQVFDPPGTEPPPRARMGTLVIDVPVVDRALVDKAIVRPTPRGGTDNPAAPPAGTPPGKRRALDATLHLDGPVVPGKLPFAPGGAPPAPPAPGARPANPSAGPATAPAPPITQAPDRAFAGTTDLTGDRPPASTPFARERKRAGQQSWARRDPAPAPPVPPAQAPAPQSPARLPPAPPHLAAQAPAPQSPAPRAPRPPTPQPPAAQPARTEPLLPITDAVAPVRGTPAIVGIATRSVLEPRSTTWWIVTKVSFDIGLDGACTLRPEAAPLAAEQPLVRDTPEGGVSPDDLVPFKPKVDVLLGTTAPPRPTKQGKMRFAFGEGTSGFDRTAPTDPAPSRIFGGLSRTSPVRSAHLGEVDASYARSRFPFPPETLDPLYFQCAPPEQRVAAARSDARFVLEGLVLEKEKLEGRLAGDRVAVAARGPQGAIVEIPLRLDTIYFALDDRRVDLSFRGKITSATPPVLVARVAGEGEALDGAQWAAAFAVAFADEVATGAAPANRARPEATEDPLAPHVNRARARLRAAGIEIPDGTAEIDVASLPPGELPKETARPELRAWVLAQHGARASCRGADLAGADLRELDLTGADLREADLTDARLERAKLDRALLAGANLTGASLGGASLREADLSGADLTGARATRAVFDAAHLEATTLDGLYAPQASFREVKGKGASFEGATISAARFDDAKLEESSFAKAKLDRTDFRGATLVEARFMEATGTQPVFEGATATGLRANGAQLDRASFVRARLDGASFDGAQLLKCALRGAGLRGAGFTTAILDGSALDGADLKEARFGGASLEGVTLDGADAFEAVFESANLTGASLRSTNLYGAELLGATLDKTQLEGATVAGTKLDKRKTP